MSISRSDAAPGAVPKLRSSKVGVAAAALAGATSASIARTIEKKTFRIEAPLIPRGQIGRPYPNAPGVNPASGLDAQRGQAEGVARRGGLRAEHDFEVDPLPAASCVPHGDHVRSSLPTRRE